MSTDLAAFRPIDIEAVYGPERICFQTARRPTMQEPVDAHHTIGRGYPSGPTPRVFHSSIFNLAWLRRDIHSGPLRDSPDQAAVYLRVALQHVMNAVGRGSYKLRDEDLAFTRIANAYMEKTGQVFRYPELNP